MKDFARAWAFDPVAHHFIGSGAGEWWAKDLIHGTGGRVDPDTRRRWSLLVWVLSFRIDALRRWRRPAGFVVLSVALGAGAVGLLKQITNVDCPWSLAEFGGQRPYVQLFADRPDCLPAGPVLPGRATRPRGSPCSRFTSSPWDAAVSLARWALGAGAAGRRRVCIRPGGARRAFPVPRPVERGRGLVRVPRRLGLGYRGNVWAPRPRSRVIASSRYDGPWTAWSLPASPPPG